MGSFFTNVQVYTGEQPPVDVREAVIADLRASASVAGFVEDASLSTEDADRVIYVGPVGPEPWIAVYDEAIEDQDEASRRTLAERLSQIGGVAVSVLVHDSDVLELRLCQDGVQVDVYNSAPDYFEQASRVYTDDEPSGEETSQGRAPVTGEARLWAPVLAPGATSDTLQAAWEIQDLFAEETLVRIAPLLGWDAGRCAVGYTYLPESGMDLSTFERLAFRSTTNTRDSFLAEGPPRFVQAGGQTSLGVPVGTPFEGIGATFRSAGGPGRGVQIVVWGPAITEGIVEVRAIHVRRGVSPWSSVETPSIPLLAGQSAEGVALRYAIVEDVEILQGLVEEALGFGTRQSGPTRRRLLDMQSETWISVVFDGIALAPGEGDLYLGLSPLENPAGQTSWTFEVDISRN